MANTIMAALSLSGLIMVSSEARAVEGREGLTFGIALGGGNLGCSGEGCDDFIGAGSLDLHLGGMVGPGLAALFETWWTVHDDDRLTINQLIMTGGIRVWPVDHFWLQGGLGIARSDLQYDDGFFREAEDHSEWVPAFQVGIGLDPIATDDFGLDIALRYGTGFYSNGDSRIHSGALTLGVSFY